MSIIRLDTSSDATWQRAWSVADAAEKATLLATYSTPGGPKRGDIIYQVDNATYYYLVTGNILQPISGLPSLPIDLTSQVSGVLPAASGGTAVNIASAALPLGSGQVTFPSTENPSANVYTLDDYREGVWAPIDTSGAGLVFAYASGGHVKIGKVVIITGQVVYPATASATPAEIGGLPFSIGGIGHTALTRQSSGAAVDFALWAVYGTTKMRPSAIGTGAQLTNAQMSNSNTIFAGFYFV